MMLFTCTLTHVFGWFSAVVWSPAALRPGLVLLCSLISCCCCCVCEGQSAAAVISWRCYSRVCVGGVLLFDRALQNHQGEGRWVTVSLGFHRVRVWVVVLLHHPGVVNTCA